VKKGVKTQRHGVRQMADADPGRAEAISGLLMEGGLIQWALPTHSTQDGIGEMADGDGRPVDRGELSAR